MKDEIEKEAVVRMNDIYRGDPERAHGEADDILCEVLRKLGYNELVDAYDRIEPKWYA